MIMFIMLITRIKYSTTGKRKNETYDSDSIFSIFIIAKVGFVFSASENTTTSQTGPLWYPRAQ